MIIPMLQTMALKLDGRLLKMSMYAMKFVLSACSYFLMRYHLTMIDNYKQFIKLKNLFLHISQQYMTTKTYLSSNSPGRSVPSKQRGTRVGKEIEKNKRENQEFVLF